MTVVPTEQIRNVIVLGHTSTGKSTLVEALLRAAGQATGPLDGCPTVDTDPEEQARGHSLALCVASFPFDGHLLNILDTPGGAEAIGDAYAALPAADLALFVVDATVGLQPQHAELWALCDDLDVPRAIFLNKLDMGRAQHAERVAELAAAYGADRLALVQLPWEDHEELEGIIDVVHEVAIDEHDGRHLHTEVPASLRDEVDHDHEELLEHVVEHDDDLLARYLDGDLPTAEELDGQLAREIAAGELIPVLCGSAAHDVGVEPLLHFLVDECPPPRPLDPPVEGATVAVVVKTLTDPYVGRISVLRLLAGTLRPDADLVVQRTGEKVRAHQLSRMLGRQQAVVPRAPQGDVVAVAKLGEVLTGDVLTAGVSSVEVELPGPPIGFHRVVLEPVSASDDAKLSGALERIIQEDPSIRQTMDLASGTRVLSFLGPTHVDVTVQRLARNHGVQVEVAPAPIDYRETIRRPARGQGRHVKQSGGHGQYGIAEIELAPRPRGEGFAFADDTVGGVVPHQYVGAVEKGIVEAMADGPLGGFPVVDVEARLLDGKHHSVDSSDAAFRMAGILAFRAAVAEADPVLLEPIVAVTVRVPDELTGSVLSDLASRRGRILGTTSAGSGWTVVEAHVPEAELTMYSADFRALTSGRGQASITPDHHDEVPDAVARRLLATPAASS